MTSVNKDNLVLIDDIWDCSHESLTTNQKIILLCMAWHGKAPQHSVPLSIGRISSKTQISPQAVQRNVRSLLREGYIKQTKLYTPTDPSEYLLIKERLNLCQK